MGKDPALLWYPSDWVSGTMGMTLEEKGAYMELLMMQFNRGHMTSDMIAQTVGQLFDKIKSKFIQDENGLWYNARLEIEKEKRQSFVNSRKNNKNGKNQHTSHDRSCDLSHDQKMTTHMENENINKDINLNKDVNRDKSLPRTREVEEFFERAWKLCPRKLGKGKVSKKSKERAHRYGDEFIRCIARYSAVCDGKEETYIMHGSTFFNSGYVDYLDANYSAPVRNLSNPYLAMEVDE